MEKIISKLTVLFEEPFWIAIYEHEYNGKYEVCKITFGAEPKDYEVYDFMLKNYFHLKFSPIIKSKTMQRKINKQLQDTVVGTKAQQSLKLQQEQGKLERKARYNNEKQQPFINRGCCFIVKKVRLNETIKKLAYIKEKLNSKKYIVKTNKL